MWLRAVAVAYLMLVQPLASSAVATTAEDPAPPAPQCTGDAAPLAKARAMLEGMGATVTEMTKEDQDKFVAANGAPDSDIVTGNWRFFEVRAKDAVQLLIVTEANCIVGRTIIFPYDTLKSILGRRDA